MDKDIDGNSNDLTVQGIAGPTYGKQKSGMEEDFVEKRKIWLALPMFKWI